MNQLPFSVFAVSTTVVRSVALGAIAACSVFAVAGLGGGCAPSIPTEERGATTSRLADRCYGYGESSCLLHPECELAAQPGESVLLCSPRPRHDVVDAAAPPPVERCAGLGETLCHTDVGCEVRWVDRCNAPPCQFPDLSLSCAQTCDVVPECRPVAAEK